MTKAATVTLFAGSVATPWPGKAPSAIAKVACSGALYLTKTGFTGDEQADLEAHGGLEKAVNHYPADHYPEWTHDLGPNPQFQPGGFGENISTVGLSEDDVCIGDVYQVGAAQVQVSQGRQPCWKLAAHTGEERMAYLVRKSVRTGWYYRVLQEGEVATGDQIALLHRDAVARTVKAVTRAFFDPRLDSAEAAHLADLEALFSGWRDSFAERAGGKTT